MPTSEPGNPEFNQHVLEVQNAVLFTLAVKQGIDENGLPNFVIANAPIFRFFAEHLPEYLLNEWGIVATATEQETENAESIGARERITENYMPFYREVMNYIENHSKNEFNEALQDGDIDGVSKVITKAIHAIDAERVLH